MRRLFAASKLRARGRISETAGRLLNYAGYGCMGISMVLFVIIGFHA